MFKVLIEVGDVVVIIGKVDFRNIYVGSYEEFCCQIDMKFVYNFSEGFFGVFFDEFVKSSFCYVDMVSYCSDI